jgi:dihydroorotate dehydrogenase
MEIEDPLLFPTLELGGFTLPWWAGNAKAGETDFVYYSDSKTAGNSRGLPNNGEEGIRALKEPIRRLTELGIKTVVQVTNLPQEKALEVIPRAAAIAAEVNPTAVEVNLSCPNGKKEDGTYHPLLANNADASGEVMSATRDEVGSGVTLGVKDSAHVTSLEDEANEVEVSKLIVAVRPYIDFATAINTIGNQSFPELACGGGRGGMSGPVVAGIAKQHLRLWQEYASDVPYLSCGGVDSENAATEIPERLEWGGEERKSFIGLQSQSS